MNYTQAVSRLAALLFAHLCLTQLPALHCNLFAGKFLTTTARPAFLLICGGLCKETRNLNLINLCSRFAMLLSIRCGVIKNTSRVLYNKIKWQMAQQ
jgi:hypothetical protein